MEKRERMERTEHNDVGSIRIADEVVGIVASLAATEVPGVAGMSGCFPLSFNNRNACPHIFQRDKVKREQNHA